MPYLFPSGVATLRRKTVQQSFQGVQMVRNKASEEWWGFACKRFGSGKNGSSAHTIRSRVRLALVRLALIWRTTWRTWWMADESVTQGFHIIAITIHSYKNQ